MSTTKVMIGGRQLFAHCRNYLDNPLVKNTGKVILLHEDTLTGGIGAEIAAHISQHYFELLDAPVVRCASLDTPVPFASALENQFLPKGRLKAAIREVLDY